MKNSEKWEKFRNQFTEWGFTILEKSVNELFIHECGDDYEKFISNFEPIVPQLHERIAERGLPHLKLNDVFGFFIENYPKYEHFVSIRNDKFQEYLIKEELPLETMKMLATDNRKTPFGAYAMSEKNYIPIEIMEILSERTDYVVKTYLAARYDLPDQILIKLMFDDEFDVRELAIGRYRRELPLEIAKKLAADKSLGIRMILVEITETLEILRILTQDKDPRVRSKILDRIKMRNRELPNEILELLAEDKDDIIRARSRAILEHRKEGIEDRFKENNFADNIQERRELAKTEKLSIKLMKKLALDEDSHVRRLIAIRKDLNEEITNILSKDKDFEIRKSIAHSKYLSHSASSSLSTDKNEYVRWNLASNKNLSLEIIDKLSKDDNKDVRGVIAGREDIPSDIMFVLSEDITWEVRSRIAKNNKSPDELVKKLSKDDIVWVRKNVALRENLSKELMWQLGEDESWRVRMQLAARKDLPDELNEKLIKDKESVVRCQIAQREKLSSKLMSQIIDDQSSLVRLEIAKRNDLPIEIIKQLSKDYSFDIRKMILDRYPDIKNLDSESTGVKMKPNSKEKKIQKEENEEGKSIWEILKNKLARWELRVVRKDAISLLLKIAEDNNIEVTDFDDFFEPMIIPFQEEMAKRTDHMRLLFTVNDIIEVIRSKFPQYSKSLPTTDSS